jgi:hypothetical protein
MTDRRPPPSFYERMLALVEGNVLECYAAYGLAHGVTTDIPINQIDVRIKELCEYFANTDL